METQFVSLRISQESLLTNRVKVDFSGDTIGIYSGIPQMMTASTYNGAPSSLFTGLTIPILLTQTATNIGYYHTFDGAISQIDVVTNFIFSSTTSDPYKWYVYNTSDVKLNQFLSLSNYTIDWGDGSVQTFNTYSPNSLSHLYPSNPSGYTITMRQTNPWGVTTVTKNIKTPYQIVPILDSKGTAYFTPIVGSWTGTPISYDFIFSGDTICEFCLDQSNSYIQLPFSITGVTTSRLNELSNYGPNKFLINAPIIQNGEVYGVVTTITTIYTGYTIQNVDYYDYSDGTTIYALQTSGLTCDSNQVINIPTTPTPVPCSPQGYTCRQILIFLLTPVSTPIAYHYYDCDLSGFTTQYISSGNVTKNYVSDFGIFFIDPNNVAFVSLSPNSSGIAILCPPTQYTGCCRRYQANNSIGSSSSVKITYSNCIATFPNDISLNPGDLISFCSCSQPTYPTQPPSVIFNIVDIGPCLPSPTPTPQPPIVPTQVPQLCQPIYKNEAFINVISDAQVQSNIFIDRGKISALENIQRIGEVDGLRDLETYGYGFFKIVKT
jgi:hypothetical protein